ncbi:winged helix-turn-helix transcriptional regulator [Dissulfurirhabdus thermomarina]|uniref:Winged helix-turn-helix transcriptional regulator n=1 Tax=Dissulfurirhabdus thermomarina TaxID=1765737 RepID=A0A6N9TMN2_DISTH|nr:winged helix-turn-helix domain-containing protein [Dissulfurirhabdus thermomarina]NDY42308.1 winged helix-turn-helix transcriptional regulator [Dissulfurirhabdus thermomarina]NMX24167.1 winged helix-turn-helix transcriptional regulator [Dissulfurirhabdus thermomarina]
MLQHLITSKARVKILMRLFLNPDQRAYLRELAGEFGLSPGQLSEELKQLQAAGFLEGERNGRQVFYRANRKHPLFAELHSMVRKAFGMDRILDSIIERLGDLEAAYLLDDYAEGKDTGIIDLLLVGRVDQNNLADLVAKTEKYIGRKIRTLVLSGKEWADFGRHIRNRPLLLLWEKR